MSRRKMNRKFTDGEGQHGHAHPNAEYRMTRKILRWLGATSVPDCIVALPVALHESGEDVSYKTTRHLGGDTLQRPRIYTQDGTDPTLWTREAKADGDDDDPGNLNPGYVSPTPLEALKTRDGLGFINGFFAGDGKGFDATHEFSLDMRPLYSQGSDKYYVLSLTPHKITIGESDESDDHNKRKNARPDFLVEEITSRVSSGELTVPDVGSEIEYLSNLSLIKNDEGVVLAVFFVPSGATDNTGIKIDSRELSADSPLLSKSGVRKICQDADARESQLVDFILNQIAVAELRVCQKITTAFDALLTEIAQGDGVVLTQLQNELAACKTALESDIDAVVLALNTFQTTVNLQLQTLGTLTSALLIQVNNLSDAVQLNSLFIQQVNDEVMANSDALSQLQQLHDTDLDGINTILAGKCLTLDNHETRLDNLEQVGTIVGAARNEHDVTLATWNTGASTAIDFGPTSLQLPLGGGSTFLLNEDAEVVDTQANNGGTLTGKETWAVSTAGPTTQAQIRTFAGMAGKVVKHDLPGHMILASQITGATGDWDLSMIHANNIGENFSLGANRDGGNFAFRSTDAFVAGKSGLYLTFGAERTNGSTFYFLGIGLWDGAGFAWDFIGNIPGPLLPERTKLSMSLRESTLTIKCDSTAAVSYTGFPTGSPEVNILLTKTIPAGYSIVGTDNKSDLSVTAYSNAVLDDIKFSTPDAAAFTSPGTAITNALTLVDNGRSVAVILPATVPATGKLEVEVSQDAGATYVPVTPVVTTDGKVAIELDGTVVAGSILVKLTLTANTAGDQTPVVTYGKILTDNILDGAEFQVHKAKFDAMNAVTAPAGGATVDAEARAAIASLISGAGT